MPFDCKQKTVKFPLKLSCIFSQEPLNTIRPHNLKCISNKLFCKVKKQHLYYNYCLTIYLIKN